MMSGANVEALSIRCPVDGEAKMAEARGAVTVAECMDAAKKISEHARETHCCVLPEPSAGNQLCEQTAKYFKHKDILL